MAKLPTEAEVKKLQKLIMDDPTWGGSPGTRDRMLRRCELALYSRIYRGALMNVRYCLDAIDAEQS